MKENLLKETEFYVADLLSRELSPNNYYHNILHTRRVVEKTAILAEYEGCSDTESLLVQLSAWFHDSGYINIDLGHEVESVKIATDFLQDKGLKADELQTIEKLILVTKKDSIPLTKLEMILRDSDCAHVAMDDFFDISEKLRNEISLKKEVELKEFDWYIQNREFLKNQRFYTNYAQQNWLPKKEVNQFKLQQKIDKLSSNNEKKNSSKKLGRGVETLYRVQLKNHIELSAIADTKANILLSVNAIIISVALSNLVPKLDSPSNIFLVMPTLILMFFSVASVVLSVLSTRPKISKVQVSQEMIKKKQTNILFFGNFYKMTLKEFEWGIDYLIDNEDALYNSLTKDLYFLGLVLERKYRLLRITYTVFMIGIIISALAFVISYYITVNPTL